MKDGHIQKLKEWQAKYGDVIRCELGEREMVAEQFVPVADGPF